MFHHIQLINLKKESKILSFQNISSKSKIQHILFLNLRKVFFLKILKVYKSKQKTEFRRILKEE